MPRERRAATASDVIDVDDDAVTTAKRHAMNGSGLTSLQLLSLQSDVMRLPENETGLVDYRVYDTYSSYGSYGNETSEEAMLVHFFEHVPKFNAPILLSICIFLGILILATILGNVFVVAAILTERSLQGVSNYLILSLAVADLLVAVLVMPLSVVKEVSVHWYLGSAVCDMYNCMDILCCTASILHLVAIAMDRYWAVSNIDYIRRRCAKQILLMVAVVWLVAVSISIPPLFGWKDSNNPDTSGECLISQDYGYTIFSTVGAFYCPLVLMLVLNFKIYRAARARIRRKHFRVGRGRSTGGQGQTVPTITVETTCGGTRTSGSSSASDASQDGYSAYNNGSCYISPNEISRHEISRHEFSTLDPLAEHDEREWGSGDGEVSEGVSTADGSSRREEEREKDDDAEKVPPPPRRFRLGSIFELLSPSRRASRTSIASSRGQSPSPTRSPLRAHPRDTWEDGASTWEDGASTWEPETADNEDGTEERGADVQHEDASSDVREDPTRAVPPPGASPALGPGYSSPSPRGCQEEGAAMTETERRWRELEEALPYADSESESGPPGGVDGDLDSDPPASSSSSDAACGTGRGLLLPAVSVSSAESPGDQLWCSTSGAGVGGIALAVESHTPGPPRGFIPPVIVIVTPDEVESTASQTSEEDYPPPPRTPPPLLLGECDPGDVGGPDSVRRGLGGRSTLEGCDNADPSGVRDFNGASNGVSHLRSNFQLEFHIPNHCHVALGGVSGAASHHHPPAGALAVNGDYFDNDDIRQGARAHRPEQDFQKDDRWRGSPNAKSDIDAMERQYDLVYLREHGISPRPCRHSPSTHRHSQHRGSLVSVSSRFPDDWVMDSNGGIHSPGHRSSLDSAFNRCGTVYVGLEPAEVAEEWSIGDTRRDSEQSSSDPGEPCSGLLDVFPEKASLGVGDIASKNGSIYLAHSSPKIAEIPARYGDVSLGQQILSIPTIAAKFGGIVLGSGDVEVPTGAMHTLRVHSGFQDNHVRRRHSDTQVMEATSVQGRWDWCGADTPARHSSLDGATGKKTRLEWDRGDLSREPLPLHTHEGGGTSSGRLQGSALSSTSCLDLLRFRRHHKTDVTTSPPEGEITPESSPAEVEVPVLWAPPVPREEGQDNPCLTDDLYGGVYIGLPVPSIPALSGRLPQARGAGPERTLPLPTICLSPPEEPHEPAGPSYSSLASGLSYAPEMTSTAVAAPLEVSMCTPALLIQLDDDADALGQKNSQVIVPQIACYCAESPHPRDLDSRRPSTSSRRDSLSRLAQDRRRSGSFSNFPGVRLGQGPTANLLTVPGAERPRSRFPERLAPEPEGARALLTVPETTVIPPRVPDQGRAQSAGFSYYLTPPEDDDDDEDDEDDNGVDDDDYLRCRIESEGYSTCNIEPEGSSCNFLSVPNQPGGRIRYPGSSRDSISRVSFSPRPSTASISVSRVSFSRASEPLLGSNRPASSGSRRVKSRDKERARKEKAELRRERKAARVLAIVTSAFVVCWLPFFLMAVTAPFCGQSCYFPPAMASVFLWLGYFNSLLNPIIYTVFNPAFRSAFRKIFYRKLRHPAYR